MPPYLQSAVPVGVSQSRDSRISDSISYFTFTGPVDAVRACVESVIKMSRTASTSPVNSISYSWICWSISIKRSVGVLHSRDTEFDTFTGLVDAVGDILITDSTHARTHTHTHTHSRDTEIASVSESRDTRISNVISNLYIGWSISIQCLTNKTQTSPEYLNLEILGSRTRYQFESWTHLQDSLMQFVTLRHLIRHTRTHTHTHTQTHRIRIIKIVRVVRLFRQMQSGVILFVGGGVGSTWIHLCLHICERDLLICKRHPHTCNERWGAGVETQKNVWGEIGGWGRVPFNETYAPSLSTIYDGA